MKTFVNIVIVFLLVFFSNIVFAFNEKESTQISKAIYQENITHLNKVIVLVNEFGNDKPTFLFKEEKAKKAFNSRMEAIFNSYGITLQDYLAYAGDHKAEIVGYLAQQPALKQEIVELRASAENLSTQYDQLLESQE